MCVCVLDRFIRLGHAPTQSILCVCLHLCICLWHNPTSHKTRCQHPISGQFLVVFWLSCLETALHALQPRLETAVKLHCALIYTTHPFNYTQSNFKLPQGLCLGHAHFKHLTQFKPKCIECTFNTRKSYFWGHKLTCDPYNKSKWWNVLRSYNKHTVTVWEQQTNQMCWVCITNLLCAVIKAHSLEKSREHMR